MCSTKHSICITLCFMKFTSFLWYLGPFVMSITTFVAASCHSWSYIWLLSSIFFSRPTCCHFSHFYAFGHALHPTWNTFPFAFRKFFVLGPIQSSHPLWSCCLCTDPDWGLPPLCCLSTLYMLPYVHIPFCCDYWSSHLSLSLDWEHPKAKDNVSCFFCAYILDALSKCLADYELSECCLGVVMAEMND